MATAHTQESREHLLTSQSSFATRSRTASVYSTDSIDTLVAGPHESRGYRGFPSKEAYLEALREWAESKMYLESEYQLSGFYGTKTMDHYKNKPGLRSRKSKRKNGAEQSQSTRRATVASSVPAAVPEEGSEPLNQVQSETVQSANSRKEEDDSKKPKESRTRRLSRIFTGGRRATVT